MTTLSNWQCDRADAAGAGYVRYKRSSRESIEAFLETGHILLDIRPSCRRGQWKESLERANIEARTARYMIAIARSGATVDEIIDAGGLRSFRESLSKKPEPGSANDAGETDDTPPTGPEAPAPAGPTVHVTADGAPPDPQPSATRSTAEPEDTAKVSADALRRADKRARGECIDCTNPSPDHVRCETCRAKRSARDRELRVNARTGAALRTRLEQAASRGAGIRITAEEVSRLLAT